MCERFVGIFSARRLFELLTKLNCNTSNQMVSEKIITLALFFAVAVVGQMPVLKGSLPVNKHFMLINYATIKLILLLLQLTASHLELNLTALKIPGPLSPNSMQSDEMIIYLTDYPSEARILTPIPTGGYNLTRFANSTQASDSDLATFGRWAAICYDDSHTSFPTDLIIFRYEENGTFNSIHRESVSGFHFSFVRFMSDGSLVGFYSNQFSSINATLYRYQFVDSSWSLVDTFSFSEKLKFGSGYIQFTGTQDNARQSKSIFHFTDTHLIASDFSQIHIYERDLNQTFSWTLKASFGQHTSLITDISWNGNDSILVGDSSKLYMYVKDETDTWILTPPTTETDIGVSGGLGYTIVSYDKDTFLANIPVANRLQSDTGRIAVIKRRQNVWSIVGLISGSVPQYYFAEAMVVTDNKLLFDGTWIIQSLPRCALDPLDYSCLDRVSMDTCDFGQFDLSLVCHTTQSDCAATDSMAIQELVVVNNTIQVGYAIHRTFAEPLLKSVTIDCLKQQSIPNGAPIAVNAPISIVSPVNAPRGKVTSSTNTLKISIILALYLVIFVLG